MRTLTSTAAALRAIAACAAFCLSLTSAARAAEATDSVVPEPVWRWRFLGGNLLRGDTNATQLRNVLAQPSTQAMLAEALDKLARAPQTLWPTHLAQGSEPAKLLRPLLEELLHVESIGEYSLDDQQTGEWTLAVQLDDHRAALWRSNWTGALAAFGLPRPRETKIAGWPTWETHRADAPTVFRFTHANHWVVLGAGEGALPHHAALARAIKTSKRPGPPAGGAWLEVDANLPRLAKPLHLPQAIRWPDAHLTVTGKGANLRSQARLRFAEPLALKLQPWHIPTNTIREPLISFTACRGLGPWLAAQPWLEQSGLTPGPDQVFGWSQSQVPFETYFAWVLPDVTNALQRAATRMPGFMTAYFPWLPIGNVGWQANFSRLAITGLPILVPYLQAAPEPESEFVVAGIFPAVPATPKPTAPPELYSQVSSAPNLVAYDWEVTQARVGDWRNLISFYGMLANYVPPPTNSPAMLWLMDTQVTKLLGNSVTEIKLESPRELSGVRSSSIGLTGFELVMLTQWLVNPAFPGYAPREHPGTHPRERPTGGVGAPATKPTRLVPPPPLAPPAPTKPNP